MASPGECSTRFPDGDETLGLRIGALFGILGASVIGVCIPFVCKIADLKAISYVRAFAGGVVIATGFVHILGDAVDTLSDPCLGWPDFPWAMMIATFATLFTFNFEWLIHRAATHSHHHALTCAAHSHDGASRAGEPCCEAAEPLDTDDASTDGDAAAATPCDCRDGATSAQSIGAEHVLDVHTLAAAAAAKEQGAARAMDILAKSVQACTLEAGIVFHSVFIGLALGINQDKAEVRALMVALMFHQLNEGLAIGVMLGEAGYSPCKYWLLGALFFLTTPTAIGVGIAVAASFNPASATALGVEGVFNAVSAGILLYNALVDFIVPTFNNDLVFTSSASKAAGFACLYLGAGVMSLIAKWA